MKWQTRKARAGSDEVMMKITMRTERWILHSK